jgi:hypothetical protein
MRDGTRWVERCPTGMPASAVLVAFLVATWPLFAWPLRRQFGVRAAIVPPLATLALLPLVVLGALWAHGQPLVDVDRWSFTPGDGVVRLIVLPAAPVALVLGCLWARYVASPPGRRRADATLRGVAALALAAGTVLTASGVVRSLHAPDPDGWASSLPLAPDAPQALGSLAFDRCGRTAYDVRRDEPRDLWVVTQTDPDGGGRVPVLALGCALVPRTIAPENLTGIAPPRGWVAEAGAGVALGLVAIVVALRLAGRHRARRAGVAGMHLGDGWVCVAEDASPVHVTALTGAAPGPVIVGLGPGARATYRDDGGPAWVQFLALGTPEQVEDTARSIATAGYAAALAVVVLACVPLAVV